MKASDIERLVWEEVKNVLLNPEIVLAELHRRRDETERRDAIEGELELLRKRIARLDREQERLIRLYRYGEIDD